MKPTKREPFGKRLISNLREGIDAVREDRPLQEVFVETPPAPPPFDKRRLVALRGRYGMSQVMFARLLNVSDKAVESWEQEARQPNGAVLRLLEILERPEAVGMLSSMVSEPTNTYGSLPRTKPAGTKRATEESGPGERALAYGKASALRRKTG